MPHVSFRMSDELYEEMETLIEASPEHEDQSQFLRYCVRTTVQAESAGGGSGGYERY